MLALTAFVSGAIVGRAHIWTQWYLQQGGSFGFRGDVCGDLEASFGEQAEESEAFTDFS